MLSGVSQVVPVCQFSSRNIVDFSECNPMVVQYLHEGFCLTTNQLRVGKISYIILLQCIKAKEVCVEFRN